MGLHRSYVHLQESTRARVILDKSLSPTGDHGYSTLMSTLEY